jgi:hypothetical protein
LERFCKAADSEDEKRLAEIWQAAPNVEQCSCAKNEKTKDGSTVAARGALAVSRVKGMEVVERAVLAGDAKKRDTKYFQGVEEAAILKAWTDPHYGLPASKTAKGLFWNRVEEASKREASFKELEAGVRSDEDEKVAEAWEIVADFSPALAHQKRAEEALGRMKVLSRFITVLRKDSNDDGALWELWASRPDMAQCKAASRPLPQLGGLIPSQRASLAGRRVEALAALKKVLMQHDRAALEEQGEKEILAAWRQQEAIVGASPAAAGYRKRADEAQRRLKTWEAFDKGVQKGDDEPIAAAWQSGMLGSFAPAKPHSERAKAAMERMGVIAGLIQCLKADSEDEEGLVRICSARVDMEKCLPFLNPNPALKGRNWKQRIERAIKILKIRSAVSEIINGTPLKPEKLAEVWDDNLCRNHRLFAGDLKRIEAALELGLRLRDLRLGLASGNCALVISACPGAAASKLYPWLAAPGKEN